MIPEGQDQRKVVTVTKSSLEGGWKLDDPPCSNNHGTAYDIVQ